jgi:hypothetical protein
MGFFAPQAHHHARVLLSPLSPARHRRLHHLTTPCCISIVFRFSGLEVLRRPQSLMPELLFFLPITAAFAAAWQIALALPCDQAIP